MVDRTFGSCYNLVIVNNQEHKMQFILGLIVGIIVATVGFTGVAQIADKGVSAIQGTVKEVVQ